MDGGVKSATTVSLQGIERWFGREAVLQDVSLDVAPGSVTALLGRNGCGKSTLLRIVAGSLARHGGEARVLGRDPEELGVAEREELVWITDESTISARQRVGAELDLIAGLRQRFDQARAVELLERWEVPQDKPFGKLSRGLQARFRLACALAARPRLLLLDEPTLGLDLFARRDLLEVVVDVVAELEAAVLIASHQLEDVERIADRIVFLREGRVPAAGSPDELRDRFRQARVRTADLETLRGVAEGLLGIRRVVHEDEDPSDEHLVLFDDYSAELERELLAASDAERLALHRPKLAEVYLEVLGAPTEALA
jgi:ABC-2 type transport system ATP-binding protein